VTAPSASLVVLRGLGGVGKTALAVQVAQNLEGDPFEAVIWTSAKDIPLTTADLFDDIAQVCGLPYLLSLSLSTKQRRLAVLEVLDAKRCLLVMDNFESVTDPEVLRFLRVIPARSVAPDYLPLLARAGRGAHH
jgi:predicted ATPase